MTDWLKLFWFFFRNLLSQKDAWVYGKEGNMWDHLSQVPALHLQLLFLGRRLQYISEALRWHCSFGVRGAEILGLMKCLAKSADVSRTQILSCGVKSHPLGLPAQAAEVMVWHCSLLLFLDHVTKYRKQQGTWKHALFFHLACFFREPEDSPVLPFLLSKWQRESLQWSGTARARIINTFLQLGPH